MTKEQHSVIPEELYNLTQLAEVTLAAGRLSTTNIDEIKEYIGRVPTAPTPPITSVEVVIERAGSRSPNQNMYAAAAGTLHEMLPNRQQQRGNTTTSVVTSNYMSSDSNDSTCYRYSHKVFDRRSRRSTISISDTSSRYDEHSCSSIPSCSGSSSSSSITSSDDHQQQQQQQQHILAGLDGVSKSTDDSVGSTTSLLGDEHACPECGKKYSTASNLARHRQTHRSIMDKKARRCPYCEKVYVSMPAFSMHVRTHSQGCECKFCGKCFSRPWLLQGHIRTHTGEKPFKCSVCDKAFADKSNLRAHIQTHSNTKPHMCTRCGKAFALKSYLYKHEESSCMKNQSKGDREPSARTTRSGAAGRKSPAKHDAASGPADSAKSTLASKLLQREKNRRLAELAACPPPPPRRPSTALNLEVIHITASEGKSYTMVTNCMTHDDFERLHRMSVIQPTTVAPTTEPPPTTSVEATPNGVAGETASQTQEQPVDFSANFPHARTTHFKLTGNYGVVL